MNRSKRTELFTLSKVHLSSNQPNLASNYHNQDYFNMKVNEKNDKSSKSDKSPKIQSNSPFRNALKKQKPLDFLIKKSSPHQSPFSPRSPRVIFPKKDRLLLKDLDPMKRSLLFPSFKNNRSTSRTKDDSNSTTQQDITPMKQKKFSLKYSFQTRPGQHSNRMRKTNQDSSVIIKNFLNNDDFYLFGVCDGHGEFGHFVSDYVTKQIPIMLQSLIRDTRAPYHIRQCLQNAFRIVNKSLRTSGIDVSLSGTTATFVLIIHEILYCANCGDSRVISVLDNYSTQIATELTVDHKPEREEESQRILKHQGRIHRQSNSSGIPYGPLRVWARNIDLPGLAMTRSMGDYVAKEVGVIADPDIEHIKIDQNMSFVVIASDGIWEMLSNEQVMNQMSPYVQLEKLAVGVEKLIERSTDLWLSEEGSVDDISVILISFVK